MKSLKDLILEAKIKNANDSRKTLSNAIAQVVTHYGGYGNAGRYTPGPSGKSGLDKDQLNKMLDLFGEYAKYNLHKNKFNSNEIQNKVKEENLVYIHVYVYDNEFIGLSFECLDFDITLTEGYVTIKDKGYVICKSSYQAFLWDKADFVDLMNNIEWPSKNNFTNVSDKDEFLNKLNKCIKINKI